MIKWYLACPLFVWQNINARAPPKFKRRLEVKISKIKHQNYNTVNRILGQTHYTKNDNYALEKVLKEDSGDSSYK